MAYFSNIHEGDKVESLVYGEGVVKTIEGKAEQNFMILVLFIDGLKVWYTADGIANTFERQTLFYPGVKVVPPKKIVEKTITQYANVRENGNVYYHETELAAKRNAAPNSVAVAVKLTGTYIVEE